MELNVQIGIVGGLLLALASIGGGVVLYRGSRRVGWRALGMSAATAGVGFLVVLSLLLSVRSEGEPPAPTIQGTVVSTQLDDISETPKGTGQTVSGMMLPRPASVDALVSRSDVIVAGIITTVMEERRIDGYGDDGRPLPVSDEGGIPVTDYAVQIETVLKGDDTVASGETLVLRMFGHFSDSGSMVTSNVVTLPNPGDYVLFALGRNPDGTYGSGPEGLLDVSGETVTFADGQAFGTGASPDQLIQDIRDAAAAPKTATTATVKNQQPVEALVECESTVELALENPMLAARGVDPIPSGFDAVNGGGCLFEESISAVTLELRRGGTLVLAQEIAVEPATARVQFPLPAERTDPIPGGLDLGSYDRTIKVTTADGQVKEVRSGASLLWLVDPAASPIDAAREALVAARQMLVGSHEMPYAKPGLVSFEPAVWNDTGLGCPAPDRTYDLVMTPGFKLVFEHRGQRYEYHTDQQGSAAVECQIASVSTSQPEPPVFFISQAPAVGLRVFWEAELIGGLVVKDGCLRVDRSDADISYLPVWPPGFAVSTEADAVLLLDSAGDVVASVGQDIRVSGGAVRSAEDLDEDVKDLLSEDCAGPFWVVGKEVGVAGYETPSAIEPADVEAVKAGEMALPA